MFSIRIVNSDFYTAAPIPNLDVCSSAFRETATDRVPVIRIYGATPSGQKTCLHVHGVFPYIYVPYDGTQPVDKYLKQFAVSVDFAVQVALGKASSSRQHVYEIAVVKGIPFYGYHEGEREFLKISLYNPFLVTRVVSLLQNGAVMNKIFQPYEAHIPYLLQFFMDYNLYGMNLLHALTVKFRNPVRLVNGVTGAVMATHMSESPQLSPEDFTGTPSKIWNEDTVPRDCILGSDVERLSFCELEVDVVASDILNKLDIGVNIGTNPGLAAIWEDEQQRRRDANESSQISAPSSQDRGLIQETEVERQFKERIKEIINERDLLIQSQIEKLGREALSPQELSSFQDSICSLAASQREPIAEESLDAEAVSQLLSQHVQGMVGEVSTAESSQVVINEDEPVVNQSIVQEVVEASPSSFSQDLTSSMDKQMIDILASLAEEPTQSGSQRVALSQSIVLDQGDAPCDEEVKDDEQLSEDEESIMMSQRVWDDIDQHAPGSGDERATDEQDSHVASQRASQYDLEGMSDTWIGSFLGEEIPQLDGAADDPTEGQEDFILPRRRREKGQARKRPNQLESSASETLEDSTQSAFSSTRPRRTERTITEMASKGGTVVGKVEESSGEDVWPLKARAIRTYSKKGKLAKMSPALNEDNVDKKDGDKVIEVVKDHKEEESAFRLFLSESSDSEDGNSGGVNLGSAESKVMANRDNETHEVDKIQKTKIPTAQKDDAMEIDLGLEGRKTISSRQKTMKLEARQRNDVKSLTAQKDHNRKSCLAPGKRRVEASNENPKSSKKGNGIVKKQHDTPEKSTPVITKYFSSPSKNSESIATRQNVTKLLSSSKEQPSTSDKIDDAESTLRTALHCSTELERNFRKNTRFRKRKLSMAGQKDQTLSHEKTSPIAKQTTDSAASLKAVSGAMSCLTVSLEDICQISTQDSKIIDAQTRLKTRRGAPRQSFTRLVDQKLNSPVRKETPAKKLRSKRKERSPLSKKITSPKRKEERTKKYGTLPVLIATSPKKSLADSSQLSETSVAVQLSQVDAVSFRSQMVVSDLRSSGGTGNTETEYSSSRSQTRRRASSNRQTGLLASGTKSGTYALSNEEMTRKRTGLIPSRLVPLKSAGGIEEKSRSEAGGMLSHRSLKRKLVVDIDKDLQSTPGCVLPGSVKKRKLSLKLKSNSSRTFQSKENVDENLVTTNKESLLDQSKSFEVNDSSTKPGVNITNNGKRLALDSKNEFALSRDLLDDITCVPSSPGEPDSSNESLMITKPNSSLDLTNQPSSSTKSQETSNASCPTGSKYETTDNVINDLNCLEEPGFLEERDTELLANALFNMSFPSPLPCGEECHSPPNPSTPLKTNCDMHGVADQEKSLIEDKVPILGSIVGEEEGNDVSAVIKAGSSPIVPFQKQVQRIAYFSPANTRVPEGSLLLPFCPKLGETQTQLENIPGEGHDSFAQNLCNKEVTCDKGSFDPRRILINKNISRTNEELLISQGNITKENTGFIFNSGLAIYNKSSASKSVDESEVNESSADLSDRKLVRAETGENKSIDVNLTDYGEGLKSRSVSSENSGLVLRLSTEEKSLTRVHSSVHGEIEISPKEDNDDLTQEGSTEGVCIGLAAVKPVINQEDQSSSTHDRQGLKFTSGRGTADVVAIKPLRQPPTSDELINSLRDYGLPQCKYQEPFCSNPDDIPAFPREVGGRLLKIESKAVSSLPEFESLSSSQGLKHWRTVMSSAQQCGIRSICQPIGDVSNLHKNVELKIALMGDREIVVTPCRGPPAPEAVKAWARNKLTKHNGKGQKHSARKTLEQIKKSPEAENLQDATPDQDSEKKTMATNVSKSSAAESKEAILSTSVTVMPSKEVTQAPSVPSSVTTMDLLANKQQKELGDAESAKKSDIVKLSDSHSPMEVTSPCSLFSPNEAKIFTFASRTQTEVSRTKSGQSEIQGTQPMRFESHDSLTVPKEDGVTPGTSFVTVTPPKGTSPEQILSTTKQLLSPLPQTRSPVFPVPYHSTPVATKVVYGAQSPRCTPISDAATKAQRLDAKNTAAQASSDQPPSLRQQLLASQFKFVTPGAQARRSIPWTSQIEGPSPNNTYGFKVTQLNLQNAKALHEVQHLTLLSLELHVRTRREARPDPEFDPICALFYFVQTDTPLPNGKNKVTGVICVDPESAKISTSATENKENCLSNIESSVKQSPYKEAVASTSTSNVTKLKTLQNTSASFSRPLLCRTGVTEYDVQYVTEEKDIFPALLDVIQRWDPDIFIGYEVQMFSWGYLLERALTFEIDLCTRLSRVKGSSSCSNMDAEKDRWGAAHTSEIKIAGRIILNVWRLMRHEVTLNSYSFENVAFHVLHERIPLFTFRTLSDWWDHRTSLNRWRTVDHYVTRCRGNVRILESVDFIGRTSELARLFGILFYSVISRGSQYRVESMMLRIAKPMNYIPVSPSVEQRGAMRAPETIPLVMEPESRFYSDPVLVLDFQSLYPSMVIAYNYCFSTCLGRVSCLSEYGEFKFGATSLCVPPSLLKKLEGGIHISPNGVAFVKPSVRKGILPSMLDEILQTRIMVKTSMKRWKADKSLGRMLDARQLGLKLIANVTFGYTSAHFSGRMPCVEIGDSIVRKARETLERAIDLVNNTPRWGARVVYGDTDSLFVLLKGVTKEQAFSIGKDIVDTVTAMNPKPVKLKFEKVYLPCVLQTKKRYVGYMYETFDQKEPVFDAKGIETVRRDSCPAVAKILEKSLRFLFETRDLSLVKKYVQRQCSKLMEGRASLQDFTFAKEYRGMKNYKPGACVPALELTRRMLREDRRSEPRVGERVPYVVVYGSPGLPLIQLVRRPHEVLQDPSLRLNASYYITKQILPPLNRVFLLIGLDVFTWYAELPRVVRVAQMPTDAGNRKKGTISQYFSTMTCPVCQELTPTDLCSKCRATPQVSAVTLINRMRGWERTHQHLAEICYGCCGSRDRKLCCVSLDCPVFYKLVQCTRDIKSSQHLRTILENL